MTTQARWDALWRALGATMPPDSVADAMLAAWTEPHRHYHTTQHLAECLAHLDEARGAAVEPALIECALWFHDAVYVPSRTDNEEKSAEWASKVAHEAGLDAAAAARIESLVLVTKHNAHPRTPDEELILDVDLAILGAGAVRFDEYEAQVRQEFRYVPSILFKRKRREILTGFLERPRLYHTPHFFDRFEHPARENLARSIAQLGG